MGEGLESEAMLRNVAFPIHTPFFFSLFPFLILLFLYKLFFSFCFPLVRLTKFLHLILQLLTTTG